MGKFKTYYRQIVEGKDDRGKRDGTGPYKDSYQRKISKEGKRKSIGEKCPYDEAIGDLGNVGSLTKEVIGDKIKALQDKLKIVKDKTSDTYKKIKEQIQRWKDRMKEKDKEPEEEDIDKGKFKIDPKIKEKAAKIAKECGKEDEKTILGIAKRMSKNRS